MGHAGIGAEDSIIAAGYDLKSTVLKVGHHGSASSTGTSFFGKSGQRLKLLKLGQATTTATHQERP